MFGYGLNPRGITSVYEDARTLGVVLVGAGVLGLAGLAGIGESEVAEVRMRQGAAVTSLAGIAFWAISVLRPMRKKEDES